MKNKTEKHTQAFEPIPLWAAGFANGKYMQEKAQLKTRDGRKIGNACVVHISFVNKRQVANIITDMGTRLLLSESELKQLFYPPFWIQKNFTHAQAKILNLIN